MAGNQDPGLTQYSRLEHDEARARGRRHVHTRQFGKRAIAASVILPMAATAALLAGCSKGAAPSPGKTAVPGATAPKTSGGTGSSPETPTATPQPTEPTTKALIGVDCKQLAPYVFSAVGRDLGYASEAQAASSSENLPPAFSYQGMRGPACRWTGGVLSGSELVILQVVENDPSGSKFNQTMNASVTVGGQNIPVTDRHFTVDGMPGGSTDVPGSSALLVRGGNGDEYVLDLSIHTDAPDAGQLPQIGQELFGQMLAVAH